MNISFVVDKMDMDTTVTDRNAWLDVNNPYHKDAVGTYVSIFFDSLEAIERMQQQLFELREKYLAAQLNKPVSAPADDEKDDHDA